MERNIQNYGREKKANRTHNHTKEKTPHSTLNHQTPHPPSKTLKPNPLTSTSVIGHKIPLLNDNIASPPTRKIRPNRENKTGNKYITQSAKGFPANSPQTQTYNRYEMLTKTSTDFPKRSDKLRQNDTQHKFGS
jgi:hypothetical protein